MKKESLKKLKIPDKPGVYFFLKGKEILYIGKATSLRDRVKSYFGKDLIETRGPILVDMVFKADETKWQTTDSVLEALILEANFIKKYKPKYNTKEKDDKSFNYVCITKEKLPRVLIIRGKNVQHSGLNKIYGPFTSGTQLREAMKIIRRIFPYIDGNSSKKINYEFYRQLGLVPDVGNKELESAYRKNIVNLKLFFQGKKKNIILNFKKEMSIYAKNKEFEHANEVKKRIFALQHINDIALLKNEKEKQENYSRFTRQNPTGSDTTHNFLVSSFRIEAYDIAHLGGKNMVGVMVVLEDGEVEKSEYKKFRIRTQDSANDIGALTEVLERRLAHKEWVYPNLIVVDGGIAQVNSAKAVLNKLKLKIEVVSVVKNEKHKPKAIMGNDKIVTKYKNAILLANSEAHRFAINYHKNMRNKNFLA